MPRIRGANFGLKILSLIIAIILWFVVLGSRNVEVTKEVPVEVITPPDLIVANDVPDRIAFRLAGPKAFLRNIVNRKETPIRVNLSTAKPGLVTYRLFTDNIQVPIGVKVVAINPTAMVIKLEYLKRKEVPLKLLTRGDVESGYKLTRVALDRNTIKVKGAESKMEQIQEVNSVPFDLSALHESGTREVAIDLGRYPGVVLDGELPKVQFDVVQATANFKIRNAAVKVLTNRHYSVQPKQLTLFVQANADEVQKLDRSKAFGVVDARQKGAGTFELPISVQLPSNVKLIKVLPSKVKVTLQ